MPGRPNTAKRCTEFFTGEQLNIKTYLQKQKMKMKEGAEGPDQQAEVANVAPQSAKEREGREGESRNNGKRSRQMPQSARRRREVEK